VLLVILFAFTLTQVDLNLTLSKITLLYGIQDYFQHIGFFNRSLATWWYVFILSVYFILYITFLVLSFKKLFSEKFLWITIGFTSILLIFSYPAFSYDIFNFMFYAKTIVVYHLNPYVVKPLDFAGVDPWLSFLHWTHRPSILPPLWTGITLVPYILGFNKFLLIMWNFKLLTTLFYVASVYLLKKIAELKFPKYVLPIMTFFALNPLVVIESIVSAHLDIGMVAFSYLFLLLLLKKQKALSFFALSLSIGIKYVTLALSPLLLIGFQREMLVFLMTVGTVAVLTQVEMQPWYFLWILPYIAFYPDKKWVYILGIAVSLGLLLRYAPYFYFGHWNEPVPQIKAYVTGFSIVAGIIVAGLHYFTHKSYRRT
jgi:hypothetical protein